MIQHNGKLEAIWIKRARLGPMDPVERAILRAGAGLLSNANQGGKRQVTIIAKEAWAAVTERLGVEVDPSARRANLMVSGIDLKNTRGKILQIGNCRIQVWGETRPCERMDQAWMGLRAALQDNWGGGVFGEVLLDGKIGVGDMVQWVDGNSIRIQEDGAY